MLVNYFEIPDCVPDTANDAPVLIAPSGIPEKMLRNYNFSRLPDGRYAHTLSPEENTYLQSNAHLERAVISGSGAKTKPDTRCIIACVLLVLSIVTAKHSIISFPLALAALILMIYVRVHTPKSVLTSALLTVSIIWLAVDTVLFILLSIVAAACTAGANATFDALSEWQKCSG